MIEYSDIFSRAEQEIIKKIIIEKKEKSHSLTDLMKKLKIKYEKKSKSSINAKTKAPKGKGSSSASKSEQETMIKYASVMDLPQELHDQLISYWDANDFGTLADVAESQKSSTIAIWARGWLTVQYVEKKSIIQFIDYS